MPDWDKATRHNIRDRIQILENFHLPRGTHIRHLLDIFSLHIQEDLGQYNMACIYLGLDRLCMASIEVNQDWSHMGDIQVDQDQLRTADTQVGLGQYSMASTQVNQDQDSKASIQAGLLSHHNMHIQVVYFLGR